MIYIFDNIGVNDKYKKVKWKFLCVLCGGWKIKEFGENIFEVEEEELKFN